MDKLGELVELEQLKEFRIASEDPDPRGWSVVSCDADAVGVVRTMLIDMKLMKARHLVCDLHAQVRSVILPVIYARLDPANKRVIFDLTHTDAFGQLPPYNDLPPSEELQDQVQRIIAGTAPPHHGTTLPHDATTQAHPVAGDSADRRKADRRG